MKLSNFDEKFSSTSGIVALMEDLGEAPSTHPGIVSMGGGNPARIPEVADFLRQRLVTLLDNPDRFHSMLGQYQSPQGDPVLRKRIARWFSDNYGWPVTAANVAITNGGQSAFFTVANMLAGVQPDGSHRQLLFPLVPEYLGYTNAGLSEPFFKAVRPHITLLDDHLFKYEVDFDALEVDGEIAGICVSRPTNPTGNVHTDAEITHLDVLAQEHGIPLVIDGAYGLPFPDIVFCKARPFWSRNTVLMLSLSKLGLPGLRSGILIGPQDFIEALSSANGLINLASGNLGGFLLADLLDSGEMTRLVTQHVNPFYTQRVQLAMQLFRQALHADIPWHIHKPEGALFLWLWFEGLPIDSRELYSRLKEKGVLVIPGNECFPGLSEPWTHTTECIRVSYALEEVDLVRGVGLVADEINSLYGKG